MKCFYHDDADGKCSGFWVRKIVQKMDSYPTKFIPINYGVRFPFESIQPDEQVYIVDYSIPPEEMIKLLEITKDITWIDHHKTAIDKYENFEYDIRGLRYDGVAASMLTYCYVKYMTDFGYGGIRPFNMSMVHSAPLFTKLIADWDVWRFDYGQDTRNFITAFNAYNPNPEDVFWDRFMLADGHYDPIYCGDLIKEGIVMNIFRDGWAKSYMDLGFETVFEGVICYAVNLGRCNSEYFKGLPEGKYDVFMPFVFNGDMFTVSMYSKTIDVSEICKKYGGGGHVGAAGFQCTELPFKKIGLAAEYGARVGGENK